ncbi:hypothetical protein [Salinibacterium sp. M195]|uniref:hypothetical protein n=1 Tax=Salinibacterium sp. M195 TaxID=2583374 RepID=UPI001C636FF4|nr:hypothetical protein [Salinibacterium sp. M195]QYH36484.1 hypothetical protein FFT87_11290 [Salinibacterium sp. M195]
MNSVERAESIHRVSADIDESRVEFGAAMTACLRAQAASDPLSERATFFGANPLSRAANEFYPHALNELETAIALSALGPEWTVASATSGDDPDSVGQQFSVVQPETADHLVLGPAGVFLVLSRRQHQARIVTVGRMIAVNGHRVPYVRDALAGAIRLTQVFEREGLGSTSVQPLVALLGAAGMMSGRLRAPVPVLHLGDVVNWLIHEPAVYSAAEVAELVAVAERSEVWRIRPAARNDSVRLTARFERLRTEVDAAKQRNCLFVVTGAIFAISAAAVAVAAVGPSVVGWFV